MRVGMVVFANKWTGAGAVAELNCRALLRAGFDARLLFVGGRNLERRLEAHPWAVPGLVKERRPANFRSNLQSITRLAEDSDVIICHLPHDHLLCVAARIHRHTPLVRAFRNPRHIRRDPYHRYLNRRLTAALCPYSTQDESLSRAIPGLPTAVLPVPIEDRFQPGNDSGWRNRLGVPPGAPLVGAVGKLAAGRGFKLLLDTAAHLEAPAHVVVVGHGELQPELEEQGQKLGLAGRVHWAGYQYEALPALYSAMDIFFFTTPGSDWGHRAISEAQGCARPVVGVSCPGVEDLVEDDVTGRIVGRDPVALAEAACTLIKDPERSRRLGGAAAEAVAGRRFAAVGERLAVFLDGILGR